MESLQKTAKKPQNVKSKMYIFECLKNNYWYLPLNTYTLETVLYMFEIKDALSWCPRYEYIKNRPCQLIPLK